MPSIPEDVLRCVAFIGHRKKLGATSEIVAGGTVFFTSRILTGNVATTYAVTARHVIEQIRARAIDDQAYIRLNAESGAIWAEMALSEWVFSSDPSIDVAVMPVGTSIFDGRHRFIPQTMFATAAKLSEQQISIGDEVFFPGLFVHHPGTDVNSPIVRAGSIAGMPTERIKVAWGPGSLNAYLIEARSIGGLSGSPVFVQVGPIHKLGVNPGKTGEIFYFLLGLVHGHFKGDSDDLASDVVSHDALTRSINTGIAVVVPAIDIAATLDQEIFVQQRTALTATIEAGRPAAEPD